MSGWGKAPGRSLYALAVNSADEATTVENNLRCRHEMRRVRFTTELPRVGAKDHLSIADRKIAPRYFSVQDGFCRRGRS
jgi:hypothetical protein